jgi:YfiH family protein
MTGAPASNEKIDDDRAVPLIRSSAIPESFAHGFSTRAGGVSAPPFDTLNLGGKWGDAAAAVEENRRRFLRAAVGAAPLYVARQVHGARVVQVGAGDGPDALAALEADGLYTARPDVALGVFVADCVPVLLADPVSGAVAAVHAGWRGTIAGVVPAAVRALAELGARPADLRAALGPAIGACCFEVGPEVAAAFAAAGEGEAVRPSPRGRADRAHVDLKVVLARQLGRSGLDPRAIDPLAACTCCDRARFYSFRRGGAATGQMMAVIARPRA